MVRILIIISICMLFCTGLHAANIYVAKHGKDTVGYGMDSIQPYQTIHYAISSASAGDSIFIRVDTYSLTSPIIIDKPLTLTRYAWGLVEFNAGNWDTTISNKHMLTIENTHDVTLHRINFRSCIGSGSKAVYIHGKCSNITLASCEFNYIGWRTAHLTPPTDTAKHNAHVIHVVGDSSQPISNLVIAGCLVHSSATGFSEAVTITGNVDSFLVADNKILLNDNIGIAIAGNYAPPTYHGNSNPALNQPRNGKIIGNDVDGCYSFISNPAGIYLDGAFNCTVEQNWLIHNSVGISVGGEQPLLPGAHAVSGNIVRNNIILENYVTGMVLGSNNPPVNIQNTIVCNNTLFKNRQGNQFIPVNRHGGEVHLQNIDGLELQNNIFHALDTIHHIVAMDGYRINNFRTDYNLYYRDDSTMSYLINNGVLEFNTSTSSGGYYSIHPLGFYQNIHTLGLDTNSKLGNPGYYGRGAGYDFTIGTNSPAYNSGNPDTVLIPPGERAYNNGWRVFAGRVDIGAAEYAVWGNVGTIFDKKTKLHVFPNPVRETLNVKLNLQNKETLSFFVYNSVGVMVYNTEPRSYQPGDIQTAIQIQSIPSGVYMLMAITSDGRNLASGKFIVN